MAEPYGSDEIKHPSVGHEESDAGINVLGVSGGLLIVLVLISLIVVFVLFNVFASRQAAREQPPSPLQETRATPAGPQLQSNPAQELQQLRSQNEERLDSYGWVSEDAGVVHIPIDRAMDIIAEEGLPVRDNPSNPEADRSDGTEVTP